MLNDFYVKELKAFIDSIDDKEDTSYFYLKYRQLVELRENVLTELRAYEKDYSINVSDTDLELAFEHAYPDPSTKYSINIEKLALLSKFIYYKHFSIDRYKNLLIFNKLEEYKFSTKVSAVIELIKKNPKIPYLEIIEKDIDFIMPLDILIENDKIYRVGKAMNSYWKITSI